MATQISKKRKFVADGVFRAELNEFFMRELAEEGYSGCDVRVTHARTEVLLVLCRALPTCSTSLDYNSCNAHPRSPGREGPPHPRADRPRHKTFQVSRELA